MRNIRRFRGFPLRNELTGDIYNDLQWGIIYLFQYGVIDESRHFELIDKLFDMDFDGCKNFPLEEYMNGTRKYDLLAALYWLAKCEVISTEEEFHYRSFLVEESHERRMRYRLNTKNNGR